MYQTGIKRDPSDYQVFRRVSDGEVVQLEGWFPGGPRSDDEYDFVAWNFRDDFSSEYKNMIFNSTPYIREFICEYF